MTIKKDLLAQINKKAQKIRDKRVDAANNKTIEAAVFDFFKNIEDARAIHGGAIYDSNLFIQAKISLEGRLRAFDNKVKVAIEFNSTLDNIPWEAQQVRGITIWWSDFYIKANNVEPSLYIDVSRMLLL